MDWLTDWLINWFVRHYKDTPTPVDLHDIEEDLEVLCARAEALHVHGYSAKASKLAVRLAERILDSKTHLDLSTAANAHKNTKSSSFSSTTLVKAAFLCGVLAEDPHCHHLAFKVGMFGLEMPRQPAKSKALEVGSCVLYSVLVLTVSEACILDVQWNPSIPDSPGLI